MQSAAGATRLVQYTVAAILATLFAASANAEQAPASSQGPYARAQ
jgi:hypothetical protein